MDTPTQALLGAALVQSFLGKRLGTKALVVGLIAGALPDVDVFIRSSKDSLLALTMHRHFTHSLAFVPIGALIAAGICHLLYRRRENFKLIYLASFLGYITHGPLDLCTSYGTVILWPFNSSRYALDCISIVDLVVSVPLLIGCILSAKRRSNAPAIVAMLFVISYITFGFTQNHQALAVQRELAQSRGHSVQHGRATPTLANLFVFRSIYRAGGQIYADKVVVAPFRKASVEEGDEVEVFAEDGLINRPMTQQAVLRDFRRFSRFADGFTAKVSDRPDVVGDMRYSLRAKTFQPLWGIIIDADDAQHPVRRVSLTRDHDFFDWWD
ncbi:MAG TPA: metal-dependent hydrolase [bacterium]|nr:metal-dependent hydrolase [bacterium]